MIEITIDRIGNNDGQHFKVFYKGKQVLCTSLRVMFDLEKKDYLYEEGEVFPQNESL